MVEKRIGDTRIVGYSLAGEETVIGAPELNVCFDIGRAPREVISLDHLCISHGHPDHTAGLHYYFTQRWFIDNEPGTAYLPEHLLKPTQDLMAVWSRIEGRYTKANLVVATPDEDLKLRRDLVLRPFAVNHGVPALGYSAIEVRNKLKPEFADKAGPELVELKKRGVQIEYRLEVPLITYCGDTAAGDFLDRDHVRNSKIILLECTFFDSDHVTRARAVNHIHVRDLPDIMPRLRNQHIVLIHVTRRTFLREAKRQLQDVLKPADFERTSFLMDRGVNSRRRSEQPGSD
jgi:ribonuclease Z